MLRLGHRRRYLLERIMHSVFISYSHVDSAIADSICSVLDSASVSYFRDVKSIDWGDGINDEVRTALLDSQSILAIVSPASLKSVWVPFEVGYCSALGRKVLPYLTHPSLDLPGYISGLKHISNLDDVSAYFSRAVREQPASNLGTAKPKPDIRLHHSAAVAPDPRGGTRNVVAISVLNHDDKPVYISNVGLLTKDNMKLQITNDGLTGQPYYRKELNPGERMDVRIAGDAFGPSGPFAPNGTDPSDIVDVVATDEIGRQFFGDSTKLVETLLTLFPDRR